MKTEIDIINKIAVCAGRMILEVYSQKDISVDFKPDKSPVTKADIISHEYILSELKKYYPDIPVISEECAGISYEERKKWEYFWLVDPLDGTKEFINGNGEFTVNIALIEKDTPVMGIIYLPVLDVLYFASKSEGAFKIEGAYKNLGKTHPSTIKVSPVKSEDLIAVKSRSHSAIEEERYLSQYSIEKIIEAGSSLKFCLIAEGCADIYFRAGHTCEWDTAAGQAILECAGGYVNSKGRSLLYNKSEQLNDSFVAVSSIVYLM